MKKLILPLLLLFLFCSCSVKTAKQYYSESEPKGKYTAHILINCENAVKSDEVEREKADILKKCEVSFNEGETVFDALKRVCRENEIQLDFKGDGDSVYVSGIDYLYELDCGGLSGWMYSVNGEFPQVGCNAKKLSDNDEIRWLYTCDLGEDVGNVYRGEHDD